MARHTNVIIIIIIIIITCITQFYTRLCCLKVACACVGRSYFSVSSLLFVF